MTQSHINPFPPYPVSRPRRMRLTSALRSLVRETILTTQDFIYPLFVRHGRNIQDEVPSMPGQYQWSVDQLPAQVESLAHLGIPAVVLFGIPEEKDSIGLENFSPNGIIQKSMKQSRTLLKIDKLLIF